MIKDMVQDISFFGLALGLPFIYHPISTGISLVIALTYLVYKYYPQYKWMKYKAKHDISDITPVEMNDMPFLLRGVAVAHNTNIKRRKENLELI
ncbi:hypothetical protein CN918_29085 [Priestia megaterium]|nr:hypothetical protein CN918_29085 [Priestia megaterium]